MELILRMQKTPISFFICFRTLTTSKWAINLWGSLFWKEEDLRAKEVNERRPEGQNRGPHMARYRGRVGSPIYALVAPFASILRPEAFSWPKTDYKNSPPMFSRRRRWRNTKPETERQKAAAGEDRRGGNAAGIHLRRAPPPSGVFIVNFYSKIISSLHCKLLANMMYDAIYFSLDLLCLFIYVWEVIWSWH